MSRAGEFFQFFPETVTTILDSDCIDANVSHVKVSNLRHAIPFNKELLLFSDQTQFVLAGANILTPSNIVINATTEFESSLEAKPVSAGRNVFFAFNKGSYAGIRERERLFPNSNPQSKYSFLRKSKAVKNEYSDWAWNNLHKSKDNFIYADGGRFVVPFDARPWLDQIDTQTLVLTGGKDSLVPEHISFEIINGLKNVESKIFTDATHGIPWTHDKELSEELDRFLEL